jgi:hypothetical protein
LVSTSTRGADIVRVRDLVIVGCAWYVKGSRPFRSL